MTKHDTLVKLKPGHPFEEIEHLFPEGFPMRDPWAMGINKENKVALWFMDMERLDSNQIGHIANLLAKNFNVSIGSVISESLEDGFAINHDWVMSAFGDAECYRRTLELADFFEAHPNRDPEALERFNEQQYRDWIHGDRIPEPMPENYEDIDPRYKSPQLEEAYKKRKIDKLLADGNYSAWDVLNGTAFTEVMNKLDPEAEWTLATDEDWD